MTLLVGCLVAGAVLGAYSVGLRFWAESAKTMAFCTLTSTVVVRGLSIGDIRLRGVGQVLLREFTVGALVGIAMAVLTAGRALMMQKNPLFGVAVGVAMFATVCIAATAGALLPLFFTRLRFDMVTSGPFITTVVDVLALIVYFEIAKFLLGI